MSDQGRLLVVEDDRTLREGLELSLRRQGFEVEVSADGDHAARRLESERYDCVVLDIRLPGRSGLDILRDLRAREDRTPVLLLTARGEETDKVLGLELGADDYVTKPFGLRELIARIRARIRGASSPTTEEPLGSITIGIATIDFEAFTLTRSEAGDVENLSQKEAGILRMLWQERGKAVERNRILDEVWGRDLFVAPRTIDTHVLHLRQKLERDPKRPKHLKTVHGVGYRLDP